MMNLPTCHLILFLLLLRFDPAWAQSPATQRLASFQKLNEQESPLNGLEFRNIGPTIMSGRVTDLEVNPNNPHEFYAAYASGGLWHTTNNGLSFEPVFDHESSITMGDVAVNWKNHTIWIGTGEVNSSRSSYAGTGIYQSTDSGRHWQHLGLEESHHIGKIILHPENPKVAWVAVLGHLYTPNKERGIYKTTDGGQHWKQTLYMNDTTGCVDLIIHPSNPDILYTSSWTRTRTPWNFNGCGEGSAIYKSSDAGEHWTKLTDGTNGFPQGKGVGRIGLALCASHPETLYAILDNQFNQPEDSKKEKKLNARDIAALNESSFLQLDNKKLNDYLRSNGYPEKYTAESVKQSIEKKEYTVQDVADWKLADADANLFDTPVIGAEVYRSNDGGTSWNKTHSEWLEGVYYTYGYYFGTISVSHQNPEKLFIAGYPVLMSEDGGKHFKGIDGDNCHPDYHRIWIHPDNDQYLITGNDGGVNISYDNGQHWYKANNPAVGQFYAVQVDDDKPYNVYGGLQDNGTWTAPSNTTENTAWHQSGQYPYRNIGDGDGMQVQVDTRDNTTVYVGYQFGNYYRINKNNGSSEDIKPVHQIGEEPFRFNWQTPIWLSKHHQDIFYLGSNCLHRSLHQGKNPEAISKDLTMHEAERKGNVPYATLTSISESVLKFGLIYTGSDDGAIACTRDGGFTWNRISNSLPQHDWVSRVIASRFKEERVYATLNSYRNDDFSALLFVSDNYGKNWQALGKDLPQEPLNVVREDPKNENILYVGSDNGLYVSFDRGEHFVPWQSNLPRVAIHDMVIQERENELVLGTHGRSVYIAPLNRVQQYPDIRSRNLVLFAPDTATVMTKAGTRSSVYSDPMLPEITLEYFTQEKGIHRFSIRNRKGDLLHTFTDTATTGFNQTVYHLTVPESARRKFKPVLQMAENGDFYLPAGEYQIELSNEKEKSSVSWFIQKAEEENNNLPREKD